VQETDGQAQAGAAVLGSDVRVLADVLAALFEHDRQLAVQLNAAQVGLLGAADLVRSGVSGDDGARALLGAAGRDHGFVAAPETGLPAAGRARRSARPFDALSWSTSVPRSSAARSPRTSVRRRSASSTR
jgi:hypothetical protein